jgi:excisionase family DNA binding protein
MNMNPIEPTKLTLNVKEAAKFSGLGEKHIRKLLADNQLKHIKSGVKHLIPVWAIEEFLKLEAA